MKEVMRENVDMVASSSLSLPSHMSIYWVPREGKRRNTDPSSEIYTREKREKECVMKNIKDLEWKMALDS